MTVFCFELRFFTADVLYRTLTMSLYARISKYHPLCHSVFYYLDVVGALREHQRKQEIL